MSAHYTWKGPNSLAFGVPLLGCTHRAASKTGPGELFHFIYYNSPGPRFPTQTWFIISIKHNKHGFGGSFVFLCADNTALIF